MNNSYKKSLFINPCYKFLSCCFEYCEDLYKFLLMSVKLEHDYIGFSEVFLMEGSSGKNGLNLKETELRLGLPGFDLFDRDDEKNGFHFGLQKSLVSGAKRGFSDAINGGSGKWIFSGSSCGDELSKEERGGGGTECMTQQMGLDASAGKQKLGNEKKPQISAIIAKAQVVGWPPIRSFRKNSMASSHPLKNDDDAEGKLGSGCMFVKVSMDGAPYLRKVDLKTYGSYMDLSSALEKMFSGFTIGDCGSHGVERRDGLSESCLMDLLHGSEYVLTYDDKDGDWMLVGDVPWEMFTDSCKRLRIMKSSDAIGLAPRAMEKCKNRN